MQFSTPESSDECYRGTKYPSADRVVHYFTASPAEWEEERQTMDLLGSKCVKKEDADAEEEAGKEREKQMEHMFDKAVTPSDVGKLNRLVIPKQHAEKYFPLDPNANENGGLVLSFEENNGKIWTFRYSYWNSSQSYVLTKGWSRFVRDKQLHAGDIVSFQRQSLSSSSFPHVRFFIGWRRRPKLESKKQHNEISGPPMNPPFLTSNPFSFTFTNVGTVDIPIASHESQTSAPRWLTHGNTFATIPRLPQGSILTIVPANAYDAQTPQENSTTKRSHETQHSSTKKSKGFRLFGVDLQDSSEIDCNY